MHVRFLESVVGVTGYMFRIAPAGETDSDGGDAGLPGERLHYQPVNTRDVAQVESTWALSQLTR